MVGHGELFGRTVDVKLEDSNCEGRFDSLGAFMVMEWGGVKHALRVGDGLGFGRRLATLKAAPDGSWVETEPAPVDSAVVRVPEDVRSAIAMRQGQVWTVECEDGEFAVPKDAGLAYVTVVRNVNGRAWAMMLSGPRSLPNRPPQPPPSALTLAPLHVDLTQKVDGDDHVFSLNLMSPDGWRVTSLSVDDARPDPPVLELMAESGTVVDSPRFAYG
jgi:hypothetical protein